MAQDSFSELAPDLAAKLRQYLPADTLSQIGKYSRDQLEAVANALSEGAKGAKEKLDNFMDLGKNEKVSPQSVESLRNDPKYGPLFANLKRQITDKIHQGFESGLGDGYGSTFKNIMMNGYFLLDVESAKEGETIEEKKARLVDMASTNIAATALLTAREEDTTTKKLGYFWTAFQNQGGFSSWENILNGLKAIFEIAMKSMGLQDDKEPSKNPLIQEAGALGARNVGTRIIERLRQIGVSGEDALTAGAEAETTVRQMVGLQAGAPGTLAYLATQKLPEGTAPAPTAQAAASVPPAPASQLATAPAAAASAVTVPATTAMGTAALRSPEFADNFTKALASTTASGALSLYQPGARDKQGQPLASDSVLQARQNLTDNEIIYLANLGSTSPDKANPVYHALRARFSREANDNPTLIDEPAKEAYIQQQFRRLRSEPRRFLIELHKEPSSFNFSRVELNQWMRSPEFDAKQFPNLASGKLAPETVTHLTMAEWRRDAEMKGPAYHYMHGQLTAELRAKDAAASPEDIEKKVQERLKDTQGKILTSPDSTASDIPRPTPEILQQYAAYTRSQAKADAIDPAALNDARQTAAPYVRQVREQYTMAELQLNPSLRQAMLAEDSPLTPQERAILQGNAAGKAENDASGIRRLPASYLQAKGIDATQLKIPERTKATTSYLTIAEAEHMLHSNSDLLYAYAKSGDAKEIQAVRKNIQQRIDEAKTKAPDKTSWSKELTTIELPTEPQIFKISTLAPLFPQAPTADPALPPKAVTPDSPGILQSLLGDFFSSGSALAAPVEGGQDVKKIGSPVTTPANPAPTQQPAPPGPSH